MYNKIILIGNLTKDPELRYTPQGTPVAFFGRQAESCSKYLSKGSPVLVEGRLQERRWESNGQQRSKFEVVAQSVRFLSRRSGQSAEGDAAFAAEGDSAPPEETTDLEPF
jgi:single-strand DNA-binding protein